MLLLTQLKWELHKLFCRRRTYLGFAGFIIFELVLLLLLQREDVRSILRRAIEMAGYSFTENFTGPTVANFILAHTITLLGGFYLALIGGDIVAQEVEDGTIRMVLCHPVSRGRILLLKVLACCVYTAALCLFIATTSLVFGIAFEGIGNLFVVTPDQTTAAAYDFKNGLVVYFFGALPLLTLSMLTVIAVAFMLSCCKVKPAAATIGALSFFLADQLLFELPFLAPIRPWLLSPRLSSWSYIYAAEVPVAQLWSNYGTLLTIDLIAVVIGCWFFRRRDLKP